MKDSNGRAERKMVLSVMIAALFAVGAFAAVSFSVTDGADGYGDTTAIGAGGDNIRIVNTPVNPAPDFLEGWCYLAPGDGTYDIRASDLIAQLEHDDIWILTDAGDIEILADISWTGYSLNLISGNNISINNNVTRNGGSGLEFLAFGDISISATLKASALCLECITGDLTVGPGGNIISQGSIEISGGVELQPGGEIFSDYGNILIDGRNARSVYLEGLVRGTDDITVMNARDIIVADHALVQTGVVYPEYYVWGGTVGFFAYGSIIIDYDCEIITNQGDIEFFAGGDIEVYGHLYTFIIGEEGSGDITLSANRDITIYGEIRDGDITLVAGKDISIYSTVFGESVSITAARNISITENLYSNDLTLVSMTGTITIDGCGVYASGGNLTMICYNLVLSDPASVCARADIDISAYGSLNGGAGTYIMVDGGSSSSIILNVGGGFFAGELNGYSDIFSSCGDLIKRGSGTLTLSGICTGFAATKVEAGALKVTSVDALPSATDLTVANGATLDIGNIWSPYRFILNSLDLKNGSTLKMNMNGVANGTHDVIETIGSMTLGTYAGILDNSSSSKEYMLQTEDKKLQLVVYDKTYGILLDKSGTVTFPGAIFGYGEQTAQTVSVNNTGNQATGTLTVALSGAGAAGFVLSSASLTSIAKDGSGSFTVRPAAGLAPGTYMATVTVSGGSVAAQSFGVSFTVAKADQTALTVTGPGAKTYGDPSFTPGTAGGSGTGAVTFTVVSGPATGGSTVTITGAGTIVVKATKAGDGNYNSTESANFTITVNKADQAALTVTGPSAKTYGDASFSLGTAGGGGTGAVTFTVVSGPATVSGGSVTITGAGTIVVKAAKAGDGNYNSTESANFTITVNKADQAALTVTGPSAKTYGDASFSLGTTGGDGTGAVTFTVVSGPATVSGDTVTITGAGTIVVKATKAGDVNYNPADSSNFTITVGGAGGDDDGDDGDDPGGSDGDDDADTGGSDGDGGGNNTLLIVAVVAIIAVIVVAAYMFVLRPRMK